jgi:hypothetical protein
MSAKTLLPNEPSGPADDNLGASPAQPAGVKITPLPGRCEKCFAELGGVVLCKRCGWYPVAGKFVEIDRAWEGEEDSQPAPQTGLPRWAYWAIASAFLVIIESIVARAVTPDGSYFRRAWSGYQFVLGLAGFFGCQLVGFIVLMRRDSSVSLWDVLLKPATISAALFRDLPRRFWIVNAGISGVVAVLTAILIIGSVPYHILWTWSVDYHSTQHLEDALAQEMAPKGATVEPKLPPGRKTIDCLIIGYELTEADNIRVVLLARELYGKLRYVGGVAPSGDPALMFELRENLMAIPATGPAIPMTFNSNWVLPMYMCEISYGFEQENKNLTDLRWEGGVRALRIRGK